MRIFTFFIASILLISIQACRFDSAEELFPAPTGGCDTIADTYSASISKIMNTNCALSGCHKGAGARQTIGDFDVHEGMKIYLDNNKQRFLNALNHNAGSSPMPKGGSKLPNCEIIKIEKWISKGYQNN